MALALGFFAVSCDDDDDYSPASGTLVQSVTTGSSDVTANSATLNGVVEGLQSQSSSAFVVGFYYGTSEEALANNAVAVIDGNKFTATIDGLTKNTKLYYQAYVTLQKTVTYKGEVKSLVTTDAKVTTADASDVKINSAVIGGNVVDYPATSVCGVVISASKDEESVRAGLRVNASDLGAFSVEMKGLVPAATYYYAAFLDLGAGVVYGDVKEFTTKEFSMDADADFVDLGLSTKWCKFNFGATEASEVGGLFAFGDTTGVCSSTSVKDYEPAADIYRTQYDVVFKSLAKATIPTADEFEELFEKCDVEWTEENGLSGYKFTGPNGNSIFLPAAGSRTGNTVSDEGVKGCYLTGSVNPSAPDFAISYEFSNGQNNKTTSPRFQALSVRPVSVAKNIPFDKSLLCKTWVLDLNEDGNSFRFDGPLSYYGTDDCWATVTNNEASYMGAVNSWSWSPKWSENTWIGPKGDWGYMSLSEDGKVTIHRAKPVYESDGEPLKEFQYTDEDGTYEVDEVNKTITLSIDILGVGKFNTLTLDAKTKLKILSLTEETAQIAILRDPTLSGEGAALLSYNYITDEVVKAESAIKVNFTCVNGSYGGNWGAVVDRIYPLELQEKGSISSSFKYEGAMSDAGVFLIDFAGLVKLFPNSFVSINGIKADGKDVKYDGGKILYGDIEDKGNYRIEFFNMFGATCEPGCSPFSNNTSKLSSGEPAISFSQSFEVSYTVFADVNVARKYDVSLITVNPDWKGTWGYNAGQQIEVKYDAATHKYSIEPTTLTFSYSDADIDFSAGSIMTYLEVPDLYGYFPGAHATLDKLVLDGKEVTFDASKVIDSNEDPKYRLELWNCSGATKGNCAFGTAKGDVIEELGFKEKMELTATFRALFPEGSFE